MKHIRTDGLSLLSIHRKQLLNVALPYWIFIDGQALGVMRTKDVNIKIPPGTYNIGVKIVLQLFKWKLSFGSEQQIRLQSNSNTHLLIKDREKWWNILFDIDLLVWVACLFFTLPHPWNIVYHVVSEGFFAVWMLRIFLIRKKYFIFEIKDEPLTL
ncbi:MAG: hypothetical protein ACI358_04865 [Candidatus Limimorpha sp.]